MTTYSAAAVTDAVIDYLKGVTLQMLRALRDNPKAVWEGDTSAPAMATGWLNYDGAETLTAIYDFGVHGAVATITSPDFANGWEYRFIFTGVTNSSSNTDDMSLALYRETSAAFSSTTKVLTDIATYIKGHIDVIAPRRSDNFHLVQVTLDDGGHSNLWVSPVSESIALMITHATAQKILKAQFSLSAGNFNGGKIYMARRQVGYTR